MACHAHLEVRGPLGGLARRWLLARAAKDGDHLLADLKHYIERGEPSPRKRPPPGQVSDPVLAVEVWPTTRRVRAALRANTVFSLASGVFLLVGGWSLAPSWGVRQPAVAPLLGVAVICFGLLVARVAVLPAAPLRRWTVLVVAGRRRRGWRRASPC